jgi:membrane-bound serine protease (ClpP class)
MLLMAILGLGVFWLLPTWLAVPVYLAILMVSGYGLVVGLRARYRPVQTGLETMAHKLGKVVDVGTDRGRVEIEGEIWNALSAEPLRLGEPVEVLGVVDRMTLRVQEVRRELRA